LIHVFHIVTLVQLEKRIEASTVAVKELLAAKKKERALLALKKRKMDEKQLATIQTWLMNVEGMVRAGEGGVARVALDLRTCTQSVLDSATQVLVL
jgi:hypothetical protein